MKIDSFKSLPYKPKRYVRARPQAKINGKTYSRYVVEIKIGERASITQSADEYEYFEIPITAESPRAAADKIEEDFRLREIPCVTVEVRGTRGGRPVQRHWGWETAIGNSLVTGGLDDGEKYEILENLKWETEQFHALGFPRTRGQGALAFRNA